MDRVIALLSALVGLVALGGALLVHNNANAVMQRQAAEIAQLKASLTLLNQNPAPQPAAASAPVDDGTAEALLALQNRIAALEQTSSDQAVALADARAALAAVPAGPVVETAAQQPVATGAEPAALSAEGPTTDCIPLGTRFMAQAGDSFPICKTKVVVDVAAVSEGSALVTGAGDVAAGAFANLAEKGCTVMVFTADSSGFAEMRVSCV
jgi:hypothetical protein